MKYVIKVTNRGNHVCNPLLKLAGREYTTRNEACEAIYDSIYAVIDGENGLEPFALPDYSTMTDEQTCAAKDDYISRCHDYIMRNGYATDDGVSASVEEVK